MPSNKKRPVDFKKGLHDQVSSVSQLTYMKEHTESVLKGLNVLLERTYAMAPVTFTPETNHSQS